MMRPPRTGLAFAALLGLIGCAAHSSTQSATAADPPGAPVGARVSAPVGARVGPMALAALYAQPHRENGVVLTGAHQGAHWIKWTKPDGTLELSAAHGLFADTGHYVLRGDAVCARWTQIDHGRENCMHLVKDGRDEYMSVGPDGHPGSRFTVVPGRHDQAQE